MTPITNGLHRGDCLELMPRIPDGSVDMILCDLPYGVTENQWDTVIPMEPLWGQYRRVIKKNGAIVLTATQPFTTDLVNAGRDLFRYSMVWQKSQSTGFFNANKMPLRSHEDVLVFYTALPTYNPQMKGGSKVRYRVKPASDSSTYGKIGLHMEKVGGPKYPTSILTIPCVMDTTHPTQKPLELMEYLIRTYTDEGDLVLDNTMGSGTTPVACIRTGRRYIGMELDEEYFRTAEERVSEAEYDEKTKTTLEKWF